MKRILTVVLIVMVAATLFTGCGSKSEDVTQSSGSAEATQSSSEATENNAGTESAEVITLRFMTRLGDDASIADRAILDKVREFDEMHPEIEIVDESMPGSDDKMFFDKVKSYISVGDYPDVILSYGGNAIRSYVENGIVLDLEPYLEEDPEWRDNMLNMFDLWQFDSVEGTYGVPYRYFGNILYYNKDLFEKYNLEVPKTIEEFEEVSKVFLENDVIPMALGGALGWRSAHLSTVLAMKKFGPDLINDLAAREQKYTDAQMQEIFQTLKDWQDKGIFGKSITAIDYDMELMMFYTGETAMHMDGTWAAEGIAKAEEEQGFKFGVANFPYYKDIPEREFYTMGGADGGLVAMKTGDKAREDASVELIKYLLTPEAVEYNYAEGGTQLMPVKTSTMPFPDTDFYKELGAVLGNPEMTYRQEIDLYDELPQLTDALRNATQGIFTGLTPMEAGQAVQDEIDAN